jgi:hypothetical protein
MDAHSVSRRRTTTHPTGGGLHKEPIHRRSPRRTGIRDQNTGSESLYTAEMRGDFLRELISSPNFATLHFIVAFLHPLSAVDTAVQEFTKTSKKVYILEG